MKFTGFKKLNEQFDRAPDFEDTDDKFELMGGELDSYSNLSDEEFDLGTEYENPPEEPWKPELDPQDPNWMQVDTMPEFMRPAFTMVYKTVLKTLTDTDIKDINVLANLQHVGPTHHKEIQATIDHARDTFVKPVRNMKHTIEELIPGYEVDAKLYHNPTDSYLVLSDGMGEYIYHWPTDDSKPEENMYTKVRKKRS